MFGEDPFGLDEDWFDLSEEERERIKQRRVREAQEIHEESVRRQKNRLIIPKWKKELEE